MSSSITKFEFAESPKELTYLDKSPMKLHQDLFFFHNKSKFRRDLNKLQFLFKEHVGVALHAAGIRDSYLKEEYSENNFIILLTTNETVKTSNNILEERLNIAIDKECYYIEVNSDFFLVLSKDIEGIKAGINTMETILQQTFENYFQKKDLNEYILVPSLKLYHCKSL